MAGSTLTVTEIGADDAERVGAFMHAHHNNRVPASAWVGVLRPPWSQTSAPNHGFQLVDADQRIVGAYLAVYSSRDAEGDKSALEVCNLAAFCVLEEHRPQSLRLVRALLRQKGYLFTDLSPSGSVPAMNERLGFQHLDTATRLALNLPAVVRGVTVTDDPAALDETLLGRDAIVYRDHRHAAAARHLLVRSGDRHAYLIYRRDRRKRLPLFASPLYVGGERGVLEAGWPAVGSHLLRSGLPLTLAERRVLGFTPGGPGRSLSRPRVKMYRGPVAADRIDYLYSELTLLPW